MDREVALLEDSNPWWRGGALPAEDGFPRRKYYSNLEGLVLKDRAERATVFAGMRRTGKTTMLKQLAAAAIAKGFYKPQQVVFVSGEAPGFGRRTLLNLTHSIRERFRRDEEWLLLIDEVQFFADWRRDLTYIADHMPRVKCGATSSADTVLKLWEQMTETGLDRILELKLPPLLFCEYLQFIDAWPESLPEDDFHAILATRLDAAAIDRLNKEFINYTNFGAFPQLAHAYRENLPASNFDELARKIKSNIVVACLGDSQLLRLLGVRDQAMLHSLADYLIDRTASPYVQKQCMAELQVSQPTLIKYLTFLEGTYLIRAMRKIDEARRITAHKHTNCKFIFENCSLPSLVRKPVKATDPNLSQRARDAVLAQFDSDSSFEEWGYIHGRRRAGQEVAIDLCHLDPRDWPLMLAQVNWDDDAGQFKQADRDMAYLLKQWGKGAGSPPGLYCASRAIYEPGIDLASKLQVVPAAQLSIALGVKRWQDCL